MNHELLDTLLSMDDEGGVLTVSLGLTPDQYAEGLPVLREVREQLRRLPDGADDREAVSQLLKEIDDEVEQLLDPSADGRGRYLVAGVDSKRVERIHLQTPLPTNVTLEDGPAVRHLLEVLDEHQPAAALLLHAEEAALLRTELGRQEPVQDWSVHLGDPILAQEFKAPSAGAPTPMRGGISHTEQQADRVQANRDRFLKDVMDDVRTELDRLGLDKVVLVGPAHERNVARDALKGVSGLRVLDVDTVVGGASEGDVMDLVRAALTEDHHAYEVEVVRETIDRALSDGPGVVGPEATTEALMAGRVHHLVLGPDLELHGWVDEEGLLLVDGDDDRVSEAHEEPRFVHRMIERALDTDAEVTPVDGEAAALLAEHGDCGALLRW